ncbi:MAG: sigma-70 family RNA polymerase sigma factor, partial [Acidobacteriota bacterium]|nr:sigma-70 family RNA polymerase sigma factor [Acidobacteriota bacterium]
MATATFVSCDVIDSDRELVERHRYGDRAAFEEVYSRFATMVYNLALRLGGDESEAADCTQETFLRVYRYLGGFRGKSSLKTWVFRVALNCCRSRYKRQAARRRVVESRDAESLERFADTV